MADKLVPACATPTGQSQRDAQKWVVETFAPDLRFDPLERFFPVDLPSTIAASALHREDASGSPTIWPTMTGTGQIRPPDLSAAPSDQFTSAVPLVLGTKGAWTYLVPQIGAVEQLHLSRTIASKLTMYGIICTTGDAPNAHFFEEASPRDKSVARAVKDGYLLTYYFFFPAAYAPDSDTYFEAEGDWCGISLLFERLPTAQNIAQNLPVLSCYFRKAAPYFITGQDGFATWSDVTRTRDAATGYDTHPVVHISQGRHNCYYAPQSTVVPDTPWPSYPDVDLIEAGSYSPNVGGGTITGHFDPEVPEWMFAVFGPVAFLFEFCAEMGCVDFDESGLYSNSAPTQDKADPGGHTAVPTPQPAPGSDSPPAKMPPGGAPAQLSITPVYVDQTDAAMKDAWAFRGKWGAARMTRRTYWNDPNDKDSYDSYETGGMDRPLLPAWFMWNLFLDPVFGAGGYGWLPPTP